MDSVRRTSIKDCLKNKIILRRRRQGLNDIRVDFTPRQNHPMTVEEIEKDERRRQSNRLSAQRCRLKQRQQWDTNEKILLDLKAENDKLMNTLKEQQREKHSVMSKLIQQMSESRINEILAQRVDYTTSKKSSNRVMHKPDSLPMENESYDCDGFIPNIKEISEESLLEELQLSDNYLLHCDYHTKLKTGEDTTENLEIGDTNSLLLTHL
ncbi:hypothetical protein ACF0H5_000029 [Mactra antiquata]